MKLKINFPIYVQFGYRFDADKLTRVIMDKVQTAPEENICRKDEDV